MVVGTRGTRHGNMGRRHRGIADPLGAHRRAPSSMSLAASKSIVFILTVGIRRYSVYTATSAITSLLNG